MKRTLFLGVYCLFALFVTGCVSPTPEAIERPVTVEVTTEVTRIVESVVTATPASITPTTPPTPPPPTTPPTSPPPTALPVQSRDLLILYTPGDVSDEFLNFLWQEGLSYDTLSITDPEFALDEDLVGQYRTIFLCPDRISDTHFGTDDFDVLYDAVQNRRAGLIITTPLGNIGADQFNGYLRRLGVSHNGDEYYAYLDRFAVENHPVGEGVNLVGEDGFWINTFSLSGDSTSCIVSRRGKSPSNYCWAAAAMVGSGRVVVIGMWNGYSLTNENHIRLNDNARFFLNTISWVGEAN